MSRLEPPMEPAEKRTAFRRRTVKGGQITFHHRGVSVDCVIRNCSQNGACLDVEGRMAIPDTFKLFVADDGSHRKCRVAWRSADKVGVTFE
jgi:hypothetical protein